MMPAHPEYLAYVQLAHENGELVATEPTDARLLALDQYFEALVMPDPTLQALEAVLFRRRTTWFPFGCQTRG